MLRRFKISFMVIVVIVFMTSCRANSYKEDINNKIIKKGKGIVIGVTVMDLANPYYVQIINGIKKEAKKRGIKIIIEDPKSNVEKQKDIVEEFITKKVDAIIIAALDQKALAGVLQKAMEKDIKVVAQATKVENCNIYVAFDEWDMGQTLGQSAGRWIRDNLGGNAEVAILDYPRINQIANRVKGIKDGIMEFAPHARIVGIAAAANPVEGRAATIKILKEHPNTKVVVGINDGGALGALAAFEELHKTSEDVFIGGIDATPEALDKIRKKSCYRSTVDINPLYSGALDVNFAIKLINGQIVPSKSSADAKLISKENIDSY